MSTTTDLVITLVVLFFVITIVVVVLLATGVFDTTALITPTSTTTTTPDVTRNQIIVDQDNYTTTLQNIDSTKSYFIDGEVDVGSFSIEVPSDGMSISGYSFDISKLTSSAADHTLFTSPNGGSGNLLLSNLVITTSGTGSKVFDLVGKGFPSAIEMDTVNFTDCSSLGTIEFYRQGLELGTGRFGGVPDLTLVGTWAGGYRLTTSIVRGLDASMTTSLFKSGTGFSMANRFLTDINLDLPSAASFLDFSPANFPNPNTLQINGATITRDGVSDPDDANITPNISFSDLPSYWKNNVGLPNTFVGGVINVTGEIETAINTVNVPENLNGTFTASLLQHFDSPANGQLRQLGTDPREYCGNFSVVLAGNANNVFTISVIAIRDVGGTDVVSSQTRVVNNLQGGRDVAYFVGQFDFTMTFHDIVQIQVTNNTNNTNCTAELDSSLRISER